MPAGFRSGRAWGAHYIAEWRQKRGFKRREVAAAIGMDPSNLWRIEHSKQPYTEDLVVALAEYYRISPADLIGTDPDATRSLPIPATPDAGLNDEDRERLIRVAAQLRKEGQTARRMLDFWLEASERSQRRLLLITRMLLERDTPEEADIDEEPSA
jgi:transcriptional regulator with XRE-family HTH domain